MKKFDKTPEIVGVLVAGDDTQGNLGRAKKGETWWILADARRKRRWDGRLGNVTESMAA
jgi:hypothetical protein